MSQIFHKKQRQKYQQLWNISDKIEKHVFCLSCLYQSMPFLLFWTGSFAVQFGDRLRFGIICCPWMICGLVQTIFAVTLFLFGNTTNIDANRSGIFARRDVNNEITRKLMNVFGWFQARMAGVVLYHVIGYIQ